MATTKKSPGKRTSSSKKVTTSHRTSKSKSTVNRRTSSSGKRTNNRKATGKNIEAVQEYQDFMAFERVIIAFVLSIIAVFLYLSYFGLAGGIGVVVGGLFFGLFGWIAWILPAGIVVGYLFGVLNEGKAKVKRRIIGATGMGLSLLGLTDILFHQNVITDYYRNVNVLHKGYFNCMFRTCDKVISRGKWSGGLLGRGIDIAFSSIFGKVGAAVIILALFLLCVYVFYGMEFMRHLRKRNAYQQEMEEIYQEVREEDDYREPSYRVIRPSVRQEKARSMGQPSRELEKAPKVQAFDLQAINAQMDRKEQTKHPKKKADTPVKSDKSKHSESVKTEAPAVKATERTKSVAGTSETPEKVMLSEKGLQKEEETLFHMEQIPIYRNELEEKFGGKKKLPKEETKPKTEIEKTDKPFLQENEKIESVLSEQVSKANRISEKELSKVEGIQKKTEESKLVADSVPLPENTASASKPMRSFAHKEEVTDVTPSSVKKPVAKTETTVVSEPKPKAESVPDKPVEEPELERPYVFPSVDLLAEPKASTGSLDEIELRTNAMRIQETLKVFDVNVQIGSITCGPRIIRYEFLPEQGFRVNKIKGLQEDLMLSLAAESIRIEAPIPGKSAVGIEVPNPSSSLVSFRELIAGEEFANAKSPITFAVGKNLEGKRIMSDIAKMPHMLIAGATGSGKSVCINTLIMSILYKADPKDVKMIMIDPKVVELSVYNGIPHLLRDVVTDPKEAAAALNWAVKEMMDRYNLFKELGVRNIKGYNDKLLKMDEDERGTYEKMPYMVVIVDEFADLMMVASKEVEHAIQRLAQLARAAGIHLVLATQRPSVKVITGNIKANIPSRVAFAVSSAVDSRTILDIGGAENLLGNGDMLFMPSGAPSPERVQGAFVSDDEVSAVVDYIKEHNGTATESIDFSAVMAEQEAEADDNKTPAKKAKPEQDEYFEEAARFVIDSGRAAAGGLQRQFSIGFNRAGRIIDQLHKAGVVGPAEGTKPRKVLMTIEEFEQIYGAGCEEMDDDVDMLAEDMDAVMPEEFDDYE